jgi:hypothetical protein
MASRGDREGLKEQKRCALADAALLNAVTPTDGGSCDHYVGIEGVYSEIAGCKERSKNSKTNVRTQSTDALQTSAASVAD